MSADRREFWNELNRKIRERSDSPLKSTERLDSEYDTWRCQRHLCEWVSYCFDVNLTKHVYVYLIPWSENRSIDDQVRENIFRHLEKNRDQIDAQFDGKLEWRPSGKDAVVSGKNKIILRHSRCVPDSQEWDVRDYDQWDERQDWLLETVEKFDSVFTPYLEGFTP